VTKKVSRSSSLSIARAREVAAAFTTLVVLTPVREERCRPTDARRD
jgi:hypothetical protein